MARLWVSVVLAAGLVTSTSAAAGPGVAVDLGAVQVEDRLLPGQRYILPQIGVRNPGTERSSYEMAAMPIDGTLNPPSEWLSFDPPRFELAPGETQTVRVALELAPNAAPGDYETLLAARLAPSQPGIGVGAAAASRLSFTISPGSLLAGWLLALGGFSTKYLPWTYVIPGMVLIGLCARWLNRRFDFHIERRNRARW